MCQTMNFMRTKGKRTKPTSRKSAADAIGWDLVVSGPNRSPHLGTLRHWIHNPREVTEAVRQILQRFINAVAGTVSQKGIQRIDWGANPRTVSQKMHSGNLSQNCTYKVSSGCESRASVPKMHPNCTYTVRSGCKSRASVPKLHSNLIEAS